MIFTTSYNDENISNIITSFVKLLNPKKTIEIGTQQGYSASLITKGMDYESEFITFDIFQDKYNNPPFAETHSNKELAKKNIANSNPLCKWDVRTGNHLDAFAVSKEGIDLLHIDICNHYDNLKPILSLFKDLIYKGMILEGGIKNHWQEKYNYRCWDSIMSYPWFFKRFQYITIPFGNNNSVTLVRKTNRRNND